MVKHPNTEIVTFSSEVRSDVKLKFGLSPFKISFVPCQWYCFGHLEMHDSLPSNHVAKFEELLAPYYKLIARVRFYIVDGIIRPLAKAAIHIDFKGIIYEAVSYSSITFSILIPTFSTPLRLSNRIN